MRKKGYLAIVLHSHLPFVKHPEEEYFLEENWLFEAITETYLPLYYVFDRLKDKGVKFALTMSITPPLANMLSDPILLSRFERYLDKRSDLSEKKYAEEKDVRKKSVLGFYVERFSLLKKIFYGLNGDIISGFRKLQEDGFLEIITCNATHEILPLELHESCRYAQIEIGVSEYEKFFGRKPNGIWLGECAYTPGIDRILAEYGIKFTFTDTHGLLYATPSPLYGVHAPVVSENGVAFFARDPEASKQVWSAKEGYPGDFNYREFYRDLGYDLSEEEVREFLHPAGFRFDSGIKMHKITGNVPLDRKDLYNRKKAEEMAEIHAGNFMFNREREVEYLLSIMDREPIIVAPFDTELFGHWWFEGPDFLGHLLRKIYNYSEILETITPLGYLEKYPINQLSQPAPSTWGDGGYFKVWLNEKTDWIYPELYKMGKMMTEYADKYENPNETERRVLNQMARELMLAQSSDWAFLITMGTAKNYATEIEKFHIAAFGKLSEMLEKSRINIGFLEYLETKDSIFPNIDYKIYGRRK